MEKETQNQEEHDTGTKKAKAPGEGSQKSGFWKGVLTGALVTAFAGLAVVGVASGINVIERSVNGSGQNSTSVESTQATAQNRLDMKAVGAKLNLLQSVVNKYFLFDEDMDKVEAGIYKGMMNGLDDPYSTYYTAEEYDSLTEETQGVYCGIGVLVSQNRNTNAVTVLRVFSGSPAEEAGMKRGDILYKVGDIEAVSTDLDVLVKEHIKGEEGTYVDLTVLRDGEEVPLHVERRMVETDTVEHQMLEDKTGYILVSQFDVVTGDQFEKAVNDLESQGMERLIIDLRDNPGGVVDSCVQMAAYVLPEDKLDGTILTTATKEGESDRYYCKDGQILHEYNDGSTDKKYPKPDDHEITVPIAVLINGQSASASEVFSGALQDYGVAKLVGTTSFGKGIVQSLLPLDDGSAIKITVAHYYTPAGNDLHKKGLTPDVEVEYETPDVSDLSIYDSIPLDRDNQVQKAIEVLKSE